MKEISEVILKNDGYSTKKVLFGSEMYLYTDI